MGQMVAYVRRSMHGARGWMAAGLALLLAGLLGCSGPTATRQIATPPKLTSHWQSAPHLGQELAAPFFAPSNPQVAYELPAPSDNGVAHGFQRTDDGGVTWHALDLPQVPGPLMDAVFRVSPLDPHNVFLQVDVGIPENSDGSVTCPTALAGSARPLGSRFLLAPRSNNGNCPALFYSTDGGDHWVPSRLALPGELAYANLTWPMTNSGVPQAQGGRLYAAVQPGPGATTPIGVRFMASADQGANWQLADGALFSQEPAICDAIATEAGTTLFALTAESTCDDSSQTTRTLWRSDDGGVTWIQEGALPAPAQQLFAASGGSSAQPLLYTTSLNQSGNPTLSGIQVSVDGGHTWQTAPHAGVPATQSLSQIVGTSSDGSLVAAMQPIASTPPYATQPSTTYTVTLYALKAGTASWRQISPPSPALGQPGYYLVAPGTGSTADAIWVVSLTGNFQMPGAIYAADALILS